MHYMSFAPIDAIASATSLLRVSRLAANGCVNEGATVTNMLLPTIAGQAIMSLRYDYAIGGRAWYTVGTSGDAEPKNPLGYAQLLNDQNYAWVNVRPKGMILMVESDWKAEIASHEVDDPSIENSGNNLKAVEIDYRKRSDDDNATVYFYRTKEDAQAATRAAKEEADADSKSAAELKASDAAWRQQLLALPYMIANHDVGFKLVYAVCKAAGRNTKGENTCEDDDSHDWSGNDRIPYHWFGDIHECEGAQLRINAMHPAGVTIEGDDAFMSYCVPAPKTSGHIIRGYKMVLALSAPGADYDDDAYADLRQSGAQTAAIFKTFRGCYDNIDPTYSKIENDLGVDGDGNLLSDKTKSVGVMATCVRVYRR